MADPERALDAGQGLELKQFIELGADQPLPLHVLVLSSNGAVPKVGESIGIREILFKNQATLFVRRVDSHTLV